MALMRSSAVARGWLSRRVAAPFADARDLVHRQGDEPVAAGDALGPEFCPWVFVSMPRQPNAALIVERFDAGGDGDGGEASVSGEARTTNGRIFGFVPCRSGTEAQTMLPAGSSIAAIPSRCRNLCFVKPCRGWWVTFGQDFSSWWSVTGNAGGVHSRLAKAGRSRLTTELVPPPNETRWRLQRGIQRP